jgi:hypothetical protein
MDPRSSPTSPADALVLAVDEATLGVGATLVARRRPSGDGWSLRVVAHAGEALRDIHRRRPKVLFVCAAAARIDATAELIAELDRRLGRGNPPLVALAATHDEAVERAVRVAGSSCYLALDSPADEELLERLLSDVGIPPPPLADGAHSMRAPPPSQRGLPPPHPRRGRTRSRPSFRN